MNNETKKIIRKLSNLSPFVEYLKQTNESDWATDVVRTKDGRNCLLGHLVDWFYGKGYEGNVMPLWDFFSEMWATEYMYFSVNDGKSPEWMACRYDQPTAKERCIAYLQNLIDGKEKTTTQLWDGRDLCGL